MCCVYHMSSMFRASSTASFFYALSTAAKNALTNAAAACETHNENEDAKENSNNYKCNGPAS